jgi:guanylate kinase
LEHQRNETISRLLVFSAPSGAGKTTIVQRLANRYDHFVISVSATTRSRRQGEINGIDYFFYNRKEFEKLIQKGLLLEYETVHGEYYGTLKSVVEDNLKKNRVVLFDIDVNGANAIKSHFPEALRFFIKPPDLETLKKRLIARKRETDEEIEKRLERIAYEYKQAENFDYIVINDDLDKAVDKVDAIIFNKS